MRCLELKPLLSSNSGVFFGWCCLFITVNEPRTWDNGTTLTMLYVTFDTLSRYLPQVSEQSCTVFIPRLKIHSMLQRLMEYQSVLGQHQQPRNLDFWTAIRVSIIVGEKLAKSYREVRENRSGRFATRQQKWAKRATPSLICQHHSLALNFDRARRCYAWPDTSY